MVGIRGEGEAADCWAGAGSPRVTARAAIVAMFIVVQDGVRLGGRLNRLK